jgi:hypothetical protein
MECRTRADIDGVDAMEVWELGSILGIGAPEPLETSTSGTPRVSREEWPDLPDDYESSSLAVQRALWYQGRGPKPDPGPSRDDAGLAASMGNPALMLDPFGNPTGGP